MSDPKKWWLISDEDVQIIRTGLTARTDTRRRLSEALHALDSGLHTTDAIPTDFQTSTEEPAEEEPLKILVEKQNELAKRYHDGEITADAYRELSDKLNEGENHE